MTSLDTVLDKDGVRLTVDDAVATVTLTNPAKRNAQSPALWRALTEAGRALPGTVRVVVLRGEGKSFSAGLDRQAFTPEGFDGEPSFLDMARGPEAELDATIAEYQEAFTWWRRNDLVSIATVQGHAIGAGFQLALACDLRIVAEDVQFAMRETSLGLVPDLTGTHPLVHLVGYARALEICATGRFVHAEEAERTGLANLVVPADQLDAAAGDLAAALVAAPATPSSRPRHSSAARSRVPTRSSASPSGRPRAVGSAIWRASPTDHIRDQHRHRQPRLRGRRHRCAHRPGDIESPVVTGRRHLDPHMVPVGVHGAAQGPGQRDDARRPGGRRRHRVLRLRDPGRRRSRLRHLIGRTVLQQCRHRQIHLGDLQPQPGGGGREERRAQRRRGVRQRPVRGGRELRLNPQRHRRQSVRRSRGRRRGARGRLHRLGRPRRPPPPSGRSAASPAPSRERPPPRAAPRRPPSPRSTRRPPGRPAAAACRDRAVAVLRRSIHRPSAGPAPLSSPQPAASTARDGESALNVGKEVQPCPEGMSSDD